MATRPENKGQRDQKHPSDLHLKTFRCPHVYVNNIEIPRANVAKDLGLDLDSKMTWKVHIATN